MKEGLFEIQVNGMTYVPKGTEKTPAKSLKGMKYIICRTYSAGVFAGYLAKKEGREVTLKQARRLWKWDGAASLSQLAMEGTKKPDTCQFPCEVDEVLLTEAIEVLNCTEDARLSIKSVKIWQIQ